MRETWRSDEHFFACLQNNLLILTVFTKYPKLCEKDRDKKYPKSRRILLSSSSELKKFKSTVFKT